VERGYREHTIRDAEDWRWLVGAVRERPLSSFHRDVWRGRAPEDWAGDVAEGRLGE
jgi:hypothetical protein